MNTIQTVYREIQYNGYVQQYGYNMDTVQRNTIQQICTDTIQMQYGEIQSATLFLSKQYNSWWKVQRSTLQFYSIGFFLNKECTWRHTKLVAKQL